MEIRKAIITDSSLLSSLCTDVQRLHAEHHPDFFKVPQQDDFAASFFDGILADSTTSIFIADADGQALGYILCKIIDRPENAFTYPVRYLLVDQISVRPAARGKGVGAALLERAISLAKELGLKKIQLDSWGFNTGAHAFFEKQGFEKFNHRFRKNL
jgi:ribosomal protein S18 acetylase RimI-like enzyme